MLITMGKAAQQAARQLSQCTHQQKNQALQAMANAIRQQTDAIMLANAIDMQQAQQAGQSDAFLDRLRLTDDRIAAMATGIEAIMQLPDPVGRELAHWRVAHNDLDITRIAVPLGVVAVIYESRPNVTADAAALCLKSGNAVILRGGSDSFHSAQAILAAIQSALAESDCPQDSVQMLATADRQAVQELLRLDDYVDVIIPRGGPALIQRVAEDSRIPVFKHLMGLCHTYVHHAAELDMAERVILNAKMRRTGICGATETILIDEAIITSHLSTITATLAAAGCEIRVCARIAADYPQWPQAQAADWDSEYLDSIVSIKAVADINEAIAHIAAHGSQHTDAIITADKAAAAQFLAQVDSAIVMHNTSTQFADGGEFGMGAEIGIATGKLHARGPVGVEQLTTFKYQVRGHGQVRP